MKIQVLACSVVLALVGCAQQQNLPDPSSAQAQAADAAYQDLGQRNFEKFVQHLDPKLQDYFEENPKILKKFASAIPKESIKSKTIMSKTLQSENEYKVSYEIAYPKNLVQYDVSFDKPNGSEKITNINIQVFGE
jgi:hypothetical protein